MIEVKIRKPQCYGRPCYLYCKGNIPEKVRGKTLLPERRYCAGQKRIRQFRSSDPKVYVPSWCPLRKTPAELRIYCFKSSFAWMMQRMLRRDGLEPYPSGADYALRYEGITPLSSTMPPERSLSTGSRATLVVNF